MNSSIQSLNTQCPACSLFNVSAFYHIDKVPSHSVLLFSSHEEAINYPKGNIVLGLCKDCGFVFNQAFDPGMHEYSAKYEETQGFSDTFNVFHKRLAERLIERYDLHKKTIIEIGCGKGEFLTMLCQLGDNTGFGFDPAYISERNPNDSDERLTFIKDFYSEKYTHYQSDFVCCKMTLEHIQNTGDFVKMVRRSIGDRTDTTIFFQIPNLIHVFNELAFWDIYYEHCSYFSSGSLARLFRNAHFDVMDISTDYNDQYLMIEARPANGKTSKILPQEDTPVEIKEKARQFVKSLTKKLDEWKALMQKIKQEEKRAVLWGSGSKGVTFLSTLKITNEISYGVDINPYKQGTYMAGSGHMIVAPDFLKEYKPDIVFVMNPVYTQEIQKSLNEMGIKPELISV